MAESLEGKQAPAFQLEGSDGKVHGLEEYAGKKVVIFFYPKDNTSGCTSENIGFRDLYPQFQELGVEVLGVSRDSMKSHAKFIADHNLPFTLLSDPETKVMATYGAFGEKVQYGKAAMGTIRSTVVIAPDGTVLKHWTKVPKAADHPAKVLEFLKGSK
ncbi:peroxiredoxin [Geomonas sp. RF6]|uniref:peroxiredoxin n=1 Tax=Geomonas sp. RF6 TaxID=2897342 RepID=UPI001E4D2A48|nr:peroxiredoxin [Geomonas sp. RF6]UFS72008.1 peroxiredoxin [Geomonas sp. RF6]